MQQAEHNTPDAEAYPQLQLLITWLSIVLIINNTYAVKHRAGQLLKVVAGVTACKIGRDHLLQDRYTG